MSINSLLTRKGANVLLHIENNAVRCPCVTPEGFRDPIYHKENPTEPVCNDAGFLVSFAESTIRAIVLPASTTSRRQFVTQLFEEIQTDDHVAVFPVVWNGVQLNFRNWSPAGENWVQYNGLRFTVISWILVPDPANTSVAHHWECGLRIVNQDVVGRDFK